MNGANGRGFRLFGHPAHAFLVHAPLGLLMLPLPLDGAGWMLADPFWHRAAFWALAGGFVIAGPAALAGLVDLVAIPKDHPAETTALRHLIVMTTACTLFACALIARGASGWPASPGRAGAYAGCMTVGMLLLTVGGWLGGELVFRHGLGRREEGR